MKTNFCFSQLLCPSLKRSVVGSFVGSFVSYFVGSIEGDAAAAATAMQQAMAKCAAGMATGRLTTDAPLVSERIPQTIQQSETLNPPRPQCGEHPEREIHRCFVSWKTEDLEES